MFFFPTHIVIPVWAIHTAFNILIDMSHKQAFQLS